ncbi:hypothetical protein IE53DRAFT_173633 [Violaceomyces palustris]|uniref:Uncharacterized protein n=1 Tax=Violaceomyces palustris TaxID=1673888 RepID=A0ACD0NSS6_9BASI|nr:hypothetical protein IE53DRAFT_173633 [Violaceomyces palustris]
MQATTTVLSCSEVRAMWRIGCSFMNLILFPFRLAILIALSHLESTQVQERRRYLVSHSLSSGRGWCSHEKKGSKARWQGRLKTKTNALTSHSPPTTLTPLSVQSLIVFALVLAFAES